MAPNEDVSQLFTNPEHIGEVLALQRRDQVDIDIQKVLQTLQTKSTAETALEVMSQVGLVIGKKDDSLSQSLLSEPEVTNGDAGSVDRHASGETAIIRRSVVLRAIIAVDRHASGETAIIRRSVVLRAIIAAASVDDKKYYKELTNDVGLPIRVTDTSKIGELFDQTEEFDEHPLLKAIDWIREELAKKGDHSELEELNHVDRIIRILFLVATRNDGDQNNEQLSSAS